MKNMVNEQWTRLYNDLRERVINANFELGNGQPQYIDYKTSEKIPTDDEVRILERCVESVLTDTEKKVLETFYQIGWIGGDDAVIGMHFDLREPGDTFKEAGKRARYDALRKLRKPAPFTDFIWIFGTEEEKAAWGCYDDIVKAAITDEEARYLCKEYTAPLTKVEQQVDALYDVRPTDGDQLYSEVYNSIFEGKCPSRASAIYRIRTLLRQAKFRDDTSRSTLAKLDAIFV